MKNIVYLIHSTRTKLCPFTQTHVGATNYLYRQLLIHNHRWNPRERERRRPVCKQTPRKFGWVPFAVVTGFPTESHTEKFLKMFADVTGEDMLPVRVLRDPKYKYEINQPDYRLKQLSHIAKAYAESVLMENLDKRVAEEDSKSDNGSFLNLKIYWRDISKIDYLKLDIPDGIENVDGIDVKLIDKENYDVNDEEDDRNYFRLKYEKYNQSRTQKLLSVAKELGIPVDRVQDVLHRSRLEARKNLTQRRGKVALKAKKYITAYDKIPKKIDLVNAARKQETLNSNN